MDKHVTLNPWVPCPILFYFIFLLPLSYTVRQTMRCCQGRSLSQFVPSCRNSVKLIIGLRHLSTCTNMPKSWETIKLPQRLRFSADPGNWLSVTLSYCTMLLIIAYNENLVHDTLNCSFRLRHAKEKHTICVWPQVAMGSVFFVYPFHTRENTHSTQEKSVDHSV